MKKLLTLAMLSSLALATIGNKSQNLQITIYNNDLSLIKESRSMNIKDTGLQSLVYENVAPKMITDSVIANFDPSVSLYSQNYRYDTISLYKILEKLVGEKVSFTDNNKSYTGTLLALNPTIIQTKEKIHHSIPITDIDIKKIPKNLLVHPSLVWKVNASKILKNSKVDLSYLSHGFSWKSDYVATFSDNTLTLLGWITVSNYSGNSFYNAKLSAIAGELNRVQVSRPQPVMYKNMAYAESAMADDMAQEESFSGYHLYKIPFAVDLLNNEKKQIKFINQSDISAKKIYKSKLYGANNRFGKSKFSFSQYIKFRNDKKNNLGIALPKGTVRVYEKDSSGSLLFSGEDSISHTPKDEDITLLLGQEFDILGERVQTYYKNDRKHKIESTIKYILKNKKDIPVTLVFTEQLSTTKLDINSDCDGKKCSYKKLNSNTLEYTVKLKKDSEFRFRTEYEIRY